MKTERTSLVKKFSVLLIMAAFLGLLLYLSLYFCGQIFTEKYFELSSYIETKAAKRIENFQSFISKNNISAMDSSEISAWGKKNSVVLMEIYRGHYLLYSTVAPEDFYTYENSEEATLYDWVTYHSVAFSDGDAQVLVYADDVSTWNFWLVFISAALGVGLALIIFLSGCKRIVRQICALNDAVQRMEEGDLDEELPVIGTHELGQLAQSLNSMRCAFKEQIEHEKSIFHAHQRMITEMSHDLRTPLTTLQIYTDILRYKKDEPAMLQKHLDLIDSKACQIKQLADNIFEYSLISKYQEIPLEAPMPVSMVFQELLSEYVSQWERQDFCFMLNVDWNDISVSVYTPYIIRLFDNVFSNLRKYASKAHPIQINTVSDDDSFNISVENVIAKNSSNEESNRIGLHIIETMMQKMNGTCCTQTIGNTFSIKLSFPILPGENDSTKSLQH